MSAIAAPEKPSAVPAITKAQPVQIAPKTIDDFGDVVKLRDDFAPTERLYQKLRAQLSGLVADADPDAEFEVKGERYTLRISARGMVRTPYMPAVRKRLGAAAFLEACTVTIKALKQYLLEPEIEALLVTEQSGPRSFDPIPLGDAAKRV